MNKLSPVEKTLFEAREVAGSATYKKRESEFVSSFQVSLFTKRVNRSVKILFFFLQVNISSVKLHIETLIIPTTLWASNFRQ